MIRTKKAGLLTKVVVLALLIYMATALLNLQGQIQEAQAQRDTLSQQVAEQTQINAELAEDVANPDDPDRIADIAAACGFADAGYFTRCFGQHFGLSPKQHRLRAKQAQEN